MTHKTTASRINGIADAGKTDIAARVEYHAECIIDASGMMFRAYAPDRRRVVLKAALDMYEEAYRAGAEFARQYLQENTDGR